MSVKTILVAHRSLPVRDRFAAALADAQQAYLAAGTDAELRTALGNHRTTIGLVLLDLGLAAAGDAAAFVAEIRGDGPTRCPVVVFAGTVGSADQVASLGSLGVSGYLNEHADTPQILPALAPYLFPDNFNRRASARASATVPVSFRAGQTIAAAETRDISRGGICIQTMDPLPAGTPLSLTMRLPGSGAEISAPGRIIWADRRLGMGVQFERLAAEHQGQVDHFISHLTSQIANHQ